MFDVSNSFFIPAPKVTSSVIQIIPSKEKEDKSGIISESFFKEIVKLSFLARRKKMINSLCASKKPYLNKEKLEEIVSSIGLDINCRAEEVSIDKFIELSNILYKEYNMYIENNENNE